MAFSIPGTSMFTSVNSGVCWRPTHKYASLPFVEWAIGLWWNKEGCRSQVEDGKSLEQQYETCNVQLATYSVVTFVEQQLPP
jgi:hypothetical protein